MIDYLFLAGDAPPNPVSADCDNSQGLTLRDIMMLQASFDGVGPALTCPPSEPTPPVEDPTLFITFPDTVAPYATHVAIPLALVSGRPVLAFNLPLEIRVNGDIVPVIDSFIPGSVFAAGSGTAWEFTPDIVFRDDDSSGVALVSAASFDWDNPIPSGGAHLGVLYVTVQPSSAVRSLSMNFGFMYPMQPLPLGYDELQLYPVVVSPGAGLATSGSDDEKDYGPMSFDEYTPALAPGVCCIGLRGNVDNSADDIVDVGDLTRLIEHLFISFEPLFCPDEADVAPEIPDGSVDVADLTALIDHLFITFGDLPPCGVTGAARERLLDETIEIGARFDNGVTTISVTSAEALRGLQFEFSGSSDAVPMNLLEGRLDMRFGQTDGLLIVGMADFDGGETVPANGVAVLRLPGRVDITDAIAADMHHRSLRPALLGGGAALPGSYALHQNRPNPFNPSTTIDFALPQPSHVRVEVFNVLGRRVRTLLDGDLDVGEHMVLWDGMNDSGEGVSSGVYFYRLTADGFTSSKKMLLLK
ncbi:MAG: T9SS type A sorting domain-containing protein [candidate division Zixibacteria bacterium]|nr:T9SS type A sorting domain-containing protein [candidate division Zixibacteria bacterium]